MMAAALTGLQFVERWGRRPSLMLSSSGETISVIMVTVCTALVPHHPKAGPAGIAFLFIFLAGELSCPNELTPVFAFVWTPMQSLYPSEVLSFNNRAKGLAAHGFVGQILSFFNTCGSPSRPSSQQTSRPSRSRKPDGSFTSSTHAGTLSASLSSTFGELSNYPADMQLCRDQGTKLGGD